MASTFTSLESQTLQLLWTAFYPSPPPLLCGVVCSGGTIANLTALWIARNTAKATGTTAVIASTLCHYSIQKACDILAIDSLVKIPVDSAGRIRIDLLRESLDDLKSRNITVVAVIAVAGTTETGSFDNIDAVSRTVSPIWLHVDAAWGGPMIFSSSKDLLYGANKANSIAIDGHKQLYTTMGCGVLLLRDGDAESIKQNAAYICRVGSIDLGQFGVEGSRPANFLYLHATLHILGVEGLRSILDRNCGLVKALWKRLETHPSRKFKCLMEPQSNILLYRYVTDGSIDKGNWIVENIQKSLARKDDTFFVSRTTIEDVAYFRVVISNPLSTWLELEKGLVVQLAVAKLAEVDYNAYECLKQCDSAYAGDQEEMTKSNGLKPWIGYPFDI